MKATDPYAFVDPGCRIPSAAFERCVHCDRTSELVLGDGPVVVCGPCVRARTELADDPTGAPDQVIGTMQARHGDVAVLSTTWRVGQTPLLAWDWIGWP